MELVYLWVKEYKNIKNQGFNFSPRFECEFKAEYDENGKLKDNCKLEIIPKNYVSIFPENINITAIVGENGSGKTTIFEIISKIFSNENFEYKVIFIVDFKGIKLANEEINSNIGKLQKIKDMEKLSFFNGIFYSPNFTNSGLNNIIEEFCTPLKYKFEKDILGNYDNGLTPRNNFKNQSLLNLFINASRVIENHPTESAYYQKDAFTISDNIQSINLAKIIIMLNFMNRFNKNYLEFNRENNILEVNIFENRTNNQINENTLINKLEKRLELETTFINEEEQEEYEKGLNKEAYLKTVKKFILFLKENTPSELKSYESFRLDIDKALQLIEIYISLYGYNRNLGSNIFDFKYKHLSSGEENLLLMYALLELAIESFLDNKSGPNYHITVMLDEIENNIHAKRQKKLIIKTLEFFNIISNHWKEINITFSLIFASHSPFILSDIPKENVIFLEKYKENDDEVKNENQKAGNCKNVSKDMDIKPFGANIHTLLSHGFFMSDGLMGEFAKSKIEEIKKFYEIVKFLEPKNIKYKRILKILYLFKIKKFNHVQSIIGEQFLQTIIKNYLDELEEIFDNRTYKNPKKEELLKQFSKEELQKYLDEMR